MTLVDVLSWEVRVPVLAWAAWSYLVIFGGLAVGRHLQRGKVGR